MKIKNLRCNIAGVFRKLLPAGALLAFAAVAAPLHAKNPIITDVFTADPAPLVVGDTVYLYVGHDEAYGDELFRMTGWRCYSSKNMIDWECHGTILRPKDFPYCKMEDSAWASQVVEKNGKFYWYVTLDSPASIGVAVADSPLGPFKAHPKKVVAPDDTPHGKDWGEDIDPTAFVDDDGTAWLCWGHGDCYIAKLSDDMLSIDGEIRKYDFPYHTEGPWIYKRNGLYYIFYPSNAENEIGEQCDYVTAPSMLGPWTYRGRVTGPAMHSFTIHPGIIDFKGKTYFFYHNGLLTLDVKMPDGSVKRLGPATGRRTTCVEEMFFNEDGSVKPVKQTEEGVTEPAK